MRTKQPNRVPEVVRHASLSAMTVPCHRAIGQWRVQAWGRGRGRDGVLGEDLLKVKVKVKVKVNPTAIDVGSHRAVGEANRPRAALYLIR